MKCDIAIIGAGPAGLAAAATIAKYRARACVIESSHQYGGRYFRYARQARASKRTLEQLVQILLKGKNIELLRRASAIYIDQQADGSFEIHMRSSNGLSAMRASGVIVATGAYERYLPFPGWTSCNVLSLGALQLLMRSGCLDGVKRVVLSGVGPLLWRVASELCESSVEVTIVCFADLLHHLKQLCALIANPNELLEALRCVLSIVHHGAQVLFNRVITLAKPVGEFVEAFVAPIDASGAPQVDASRSISCKLIGTGYGLLPDTTLTRVAGCEHCYNEHLQGWLPACTAHLETSLKGLFVAGEATTVGGFSKAVVEGQMAAFSALRHIGAIGEGEFKNRFRGVLARRSKLLRISWALNKMPRMDGWWEWLPDDTVLCRCEDVTAGEVRSAMKQLSNRYCDMNLIKFVTRCCMGYCQGRTCSPILETFISVHNNLAVRTGTFLKCRFPTEPIMLYELSMLQ